MFYNSQCMNSDATAVNNHQQRKAIIIGIDGAVWELLDRWIDDGTLVNLKRVIDAGIKGNLASTLPPVTAPAWVSFATGTNPGKHGCYDFVHPMGDLDNLRTITSKDIRVNTIYEYLDKQSRKSILINLPVSFPPKTDNITLGCLVTKGDNYVFPEYLKEELQILKNYRIVPDMRLVVENRIDEYVKDISRLESEKFDCVKSLLAKKDWGMFFVLFSGTDWIQHIMHHQLLDGSDNNTVVLAKNFYKQIDDYIGWFFDNLPRNTTLILMSDHGFKAFKGFVCINEWLREKGYLSTKVKTKEQPLPHLLIEKLQEARIDQRNQNNDELDMKDSDEARTIKLPGWLLTTLAITLKPFAPIHRRVKNYLGIQLDAKSDEAKTDRNKSASPEILDVDIDNTKAFCPTYQSASIYINLEQRFINGTVKDEEYDDIRSELISKLKNLKHPVSEEPMFKDVLKKEDVYAGTALGEAPDIILVRNDYEVSADFTGEIFKEQLVNGHSEVGIFVAAGDEIVNRQEILSDLSIIDIAPTVLHIMDVPIPKEMDGRILFEIFKEDSEAKERKPDYTAVFTYENEVKSKIKKLKNLGRL